MTFTRATIAAAVVAAASAFAPAPVALNGQVRLRSATCDVSMAMDRRAAAALIVGAPAAAFAVGGDSPKQAYFATSPLSSPFGETYTNQATRLWVELGETEKGIYTRVARETSVKLAEVVGYIQRNEWDRSRTALRGYMYETRKSMTRLTVASGDPEAAKLFKLFKKQIEATDLALSKKDEATADRLLQGASTSYSSWLQVVGISV